MNTYLKLVLALIWTVLIFYLTTIPNFRPTSSSFLSLLLSEGGHFFFFGIEALLLRPLTKHHLWITVLYGLAIELLQRGIPGRQFSLVDLSLDALGAVVLLAVFKQSKLRL